MSKPLTQSEAPGPILNFSGPKAPDGLWVGKSITLESCLSHSPLSMRMTRCRARSHSAAATQLFDARATIGPPMEAQTERVQRSCH